MNLNGGVHSIAGVASSFVHVEYLLNLHFLSAELRDGTV